MRMEIQYFDVSLMQFGPHTVYEKGDLTICRDELLAILFKYSAFKEVDLQISCPGESTRLTNILEISASRVKAGIDRPCYFPGMASGPFQAGFGKTNALQGCAVMEMGQMPGLFGGVVDMQGVGASLTPFSKTFNLCIVSKPRPGVEKKEYCSTLKKAGLQTAAYLAKATIGQQPDDIELFDLTPRSPAIRQLPRVGYLFQLYSSGRLRQPFVYGAEYRHFYPTLLHPNEILDGAVVCGHYDASFGLKNPTYTLVNHPVVLDLYRRHGHEINFRGVVIAPEPTTMAEIRRTAMMSANLLKHGLDVEGVIITKEGGGHATVDLMANCEACEAINISTVLIDTEWLGSEGESDLPGLSMTSNANAIISIGNIEEVVKLDPMEKIIGGNTMAEVDGNLAHDGMVPIRCIPEAISQLGAGNLRAKGSIHGGIKRNVDCGKPASQRAVEMLLKKLSGLPWESEINLPKDRRRQPI